MNMTRNIIWCSRQMKAFVISRPCSRFINNINIRDIKNSSSKVLIHTVRKVSYPFQKQTYLMNNRNITTACENNPDTLFEKVCSETLESLTAYFEELVETKQKLANAEVLYSSGVLTINLGKHGTYVINRQSPNKQIWLSSPVSGPKRYDFNLKNQCWVYKRDSITLHQLLKSEISVILGEDIHMSECAYSKSEGL